MIATLPTLRTIDEAVNFNKCDGSDRHFTNPGGIMKLGILAIAATVLSIANVPAAASATYTVPFMGSGLHYHAPLESGDPVDVTWIGAIQLVVDTSSDGAYGMADVASFSFISNAANFTWHSGDLPGEATGPDGNIVITGLHTAQYQILNGQFTGLSFIYQTPQDFVASEPDGSILENTNVNEYTGEAEAYYLNGHLTAEVVPEPGGASLILLGLGAVAAFRRRRHSLASS